jgi:ABC-type Na+ efflux pump permease subunit
MSWWSGALLIARKDVQYMLRRGTTILWTFAMPIMFFYFIGTITAGFGSDEVVRDRIALEAPDGSGFLVDQLILRLEQQDYEVVRVRADERQAEYRRRLVVPERLTDSVLASEQVTIEFVRQGGGIGSDYDEIRVGRAVYSVLADLMVSPEEGEPPSAEAFARLNQTPRALTLTVAPAGKRLDPPSGFEQAIPGTMVMFTLLVLLTSGAVLLVIERREGLLRRLASTPIPRSAVVAGKWAGKMTLGLVQIGFAMAAGSVLFDMDWGERLPMVLVVMFAYAALTASLGVLLGSVARTENQATGLGVLAANVLAALGGCWWPIEITPQWLQGVARFLPTGAAMDALHRLISFGLPAWSAVPHTVGMLLASVVVGWLAVRAFRFQ